MSFTITFEGAEYGFSTLEDLNEFIAKNNIDAEKAAEWVSLFNVQAQASGIEPITPTETTPASQQSDLIDMAATNAGEKATELDPAAGNTESTDTTEA